MTSTRATTSLGAIEGTAEGGLAVFRGIPFARPPVGELRFQPPEAAEPWDGVRSTQEFGPAPPQLVDGMVQELGLLGEHEFDEDCLTLNVWTPGLDDRRRPVLVWIHGGAFMNGTGAAPIYDGARIADRGDVVVVTMNYRVGALGFLALDGLPAGCGLRGANFGLLDQLAALRWVREEISNFGGDPRQVTLFGESAGAGSICALLAMPAARGLFGRAIVQSAAPEGFMSSEEAAQRTEKVLDKLGLSPQTAGRLRDVSVDELLSAQQAALAEGPYSAGMFFVPVVDGRTLPGFPLEAIADGSAADVELIVGTTREEMQLYSRAMGTGSMPADRLSRIAGRRAPGVAADGRPNGEALLDAYRDARAARGESTDPPDVYHALESDFRIRCPSIRLAEAQAGRQAQTYMYLFTWVSPRYGGELGSCHALDLPFTFGTLDAPRMPEFAGSGPEARRLSDRIIDAWLAFARDGSPGHDGIGAWSPYEADRRTTMILGPECGAEAAPREPERAIWERLLAGAAASA